MLNPRWAEAPVQVVELVTHYLKASEESNPIAIEECQRQQRQKVIESIEKKLDPLRRWIFHFNVIGAMQSIRDGQMITVDGTQGTVTLEKPVAASSQHEQT